MSYQQHIADLISRLPEGDNKRAMQEELKKLAAATERTNEATAKTVKVHEEMKEIHRRLDEENAQLDAQLADVLEGFNS